MATIKENCKKLRKYLQPLKIEKKTKMSYSKDDILFVIRKKEKAQFT